MSPFAEPEPNTRMKKHLSHFRLVLALASLLALRLSGFAAVLVDGTWADGTRTNTSYPTDAAWYTSGGAALMTAYTNMLSVTNNLNGTSSSQWYTYFTAQGSPVHLGVGDTLTITLAFKVDGVGAQNSSKNFRSERDQFQSMVHLLHCPRQSRALGRGRYSDHHAGFQSGRRWRAE